MEKHSENSGDRDAIPRGAARVDLLRMAFIFYGVLFAAAILGSLWSGTSLFFPFPDAEVGGVAFLIDALAGALTAVFVIGLSDLVTSRTRWGQRMARELVMMIGQPSIRDCILLGIASGVAEEAFFRGVLQPRFGLVATSLIFGMAHFVPKRELLPWTGFAFGAGFLLGGLSEVTESLVAPIVAHVGINAVNLRRLGTRYG